MGNWGCRLCSVLFIMYILMQRVHESTLVYAKFGALSFSLSHIFSFSLEFYMNGPRGTKSHFRILGSIHLLTI